MNVHHIVHQTLAEGPGCRCAVWLQGCSLRCRGCFAQDKWSFEERWRLRAEDILDSMLPSEQGITVLGGEPFDQKEELAPLLVGAWARGLSTVVFTGYTLEHLQALHDASVDAILAHTDVLIDGPYREDLASTERPLVGSANQRFLFLTDRYAQHDFQPNRIELRVARNGTLTINGMADDESLRRLSLTVKTY